jgi:hypothetical protein
MFVAQAVFIVGRLRLAEPGVPDRDHFVRSQVAEVEILLAEEFVFHGSR